MLRAGRLRCLPQSAALCRLGSRASGLAVRGSIARLAIEAKKPAAGTGKDSNAYSSTLFLPKTTFPIRANAKEREPELQAICSDALYKWQFGDASPRSGGAARKSFVLHDGPPYANGSLHMGHFLNKVLKDIVNRYKLMRGYRIDFVPGWDCHGLPIELKALGQIRAQDHSTLSAMDVRKHARDFASAAIADQRQEFKRWGVMGDWERSYFTMDASYEAAQLGVFREMVNRGFIYRGLKPVHWSPSSKTALAEAELEYVEAHRSTAVFAAFPLPATQMAQPAKDAGLAQFAGLSALIWTTTPWTIPANKAVCFNPEVEYSVLRVGAAGGSQQQHLLVASSLVGKLQEKLQKAAAAAGGAGGESAVVASFKGSALAGSVCCHPLTGAASPLLPGAHVTTETGSGLVHTAPGFGVDDFNVCQQHGIKVFAPVDDGGVFTAEAGAAFAGKEIFGDGTKAVMQALRDNGRVVHSEQYSHRYPYDWRTKKPVIFRATRQWFARLDGLQQTSLSALEAVQMVPPSGRARLSSFLRDRREWCISRQRHWGVPIPAFYDKQSGEALMNDDTIKHVQDLFAKHGSNCWWTLSTKELLPPKYQGESDRYVRGADTMDVWFDSGCSWSGALQPRGVRVPADLVLEGSDQHRGWFQSLMLTSVAATGAAPYKAILTHGFTLDEQGRKMSKSEGNVIEPKQIINGIAAAPKPKKQGKKGGAGAAAATEGKQEQSKPAVAYGADVLRLWVSSTDFSSDVHIGPNIIDSMSETLKKFRLLSRFMLGCLADFEPKHAVASAAMQFGLDRYMLHQLHEFSESVTQAYDSYNFGKVFQAVSSFQHLVSALYVDVCKDRLYIDAKDSHSRRAAQTVLAQVLVAFTKALAPIVCHTAEDVYQHSPPALRSLFGPATAIETGASLASVFAHGWLEAPAGWRDDALNQRWQLVRRVRGHVTKAIELARTSGAEADRIGGSVEAEVVIEAPAGSGVLAVLQSVGEELNAVLIASSTTLRAAAADSATPEGAVVVSASEDDLQGTACALRVFVRKSKGTKCPRCWKVSQAPKSTDGLCARCSQVLESRR